MYSLLICANGNVLKSNVIANGFFQLKRNDYVSLPRWCSNIRGARSSDIRPIWSHRKTNCQLRILNLNGMTNDVDTQIQNKLAASSDFIHFSGLIKYCQIIVTTNTIYIYITTALSRCLPLTVFGIKSSVRSLQRKFWPVPSIQM